MIDVQKLLDPEIAAILAAAPVMQILSIDEIPAARQSRAATRLLPTLSGAVERTDYTVPGFEGAPDVTVRVHRPVRAATGLRPCIYWMHGGGYIFGTYDQEDDRFDRWAQQYDCVGVSVEYRLAPEAPYPAAVHDAFAGLRWVHEHAEELGVDRGCIGVGGPSAGAGLAAGLALFVRDYTDIELAFQLLIYPMLDDRQVTPSSEWEVPVWSPRVNRVGWTSYLGALHGTDEVPIYAAPARAEDLSGLPPALIVVGSLDGFCDEDIEYAQRLTRANVPTEFHLYPGAPHGFDSMAVGTALGRRATATIEDWLGRQLA